MSTGQDEPDNVVPMMFKHDLPYVKSKVSCPCLCSLGKARPSIRDQNSTLPASTRLSSPTTRTWGSEKVRRTSSNSWQSSHGASDWEILADPSAAFGITTNSICTYVRKFRLTDLRILVAERMESWMSGRLGQSTSVNDKSCEGQRIDFSNRSKRVFRCC